MIAHVQKRWLIYALGGGLGHLTRTLALSRAALRSNPSLSIQLLTNCSYLDPPTVLAEMGARFQLHWLNHESSKETTVAAVRQLLATTSFNTLVVDTFPRGLGGELGDLLQRLPQAKVLIQRDLNPKYLKRLAVQSAIQQYDLVLVPGEPPPNLQHPRVQRTTPWLFRDSNELPSVDTAMGLLQLKRAKHPIVIVSGCGRPDEQAAWFEFSKTLKEQVGDRACVRHVAPTSSPRLWPLLDALPAVDLLIGSGGYNTVNETRATGTPLLAIAQPRLYDRQAIRLRPAEQAADFDDVLSRATAWINDYFPKRQPGRPRYCNGTQQAVQAIDCQCDIMVGDERLELPTSSV